MNKLVGATLLIAGTSIGAGMLALPVISCFTGFIPSLLALVICWAFLFTTALLLLDVNLSIPGDVNLITMAEKTLGPLGKIVCWGTYLLLLYSLTSAYIAGSAPLFSEALYFVSGWTAPDWFGPLPLLFLFAIFIYLGTETVDWVNRLFMLGLILSYCLLTALLPSHLNSDLLSHVKPEAVWLVIPVMITAFGFHIIIPTLVTYLHRNKGDLRKTLFIGSLIPLLVYAIWQCLVLGSVPLENLTAAWIKGESSAAPLTTLASPLVSTFAKAFSFFAIITSFLGVSLSLSDFLTDGLHMKRFALGKEIACFLTFVPPFVFVLTYSRGFILALQFAGIFVAILLCILPALMAWTLPAYRKPSKRLLLSFILLFSLMIIGLDLLEHLGILKQLCSI